MTLFKQLALFLELSALATCGSYSPALNPEPVGKNAVGKKDHEEIGCSISRGSICFRSGKRFGQDRRDGGRS